MKFCVAIIVLFACVYAQDEEVAPTPTKDPECYVGTTIYNGTAVVTNEDTVVCDAQMTTCQTKVEVSPGEYRIYRQCQTAEACANIQNSNPQQCYSDEAEEKQEKVCHFCCTGDFCNDGSEIDITLPTVEV